MFRIHWKIILIIGVSFVASLVSPMVHGDKLPLSIEGKEVLTSVTTKIDFQKAKKGTVVAFLSAQCPCSASHEQTLAALEQEFGPKGFEFIGIHSNADEDSHMTKDHFGKRPFSFSIIQDDGSNFAKTFGALKTPHIYLVDPHGEILYQGGVDDSHDSKNSKEHYLKNALTEMAENKPISKSLTRTLGCAIKRN